MLKKVLILLFLMMYIMLCDCQCFFRSSAKKTLSVNKRQTPPRPYTANQIKIFSDWKSKHGVRYSNKQVANEREDIFHENLAKINAHNANPQNTYKMGLNGLSHYTFDEIAESRLFNMSEYMKDMPRKAKKFKFHRQERQSSSPYRVVCYWDTKSVLRSGNQSFTVDKIDPNICTHIIYGFYGVYPNGSLYSLNPSVDFADNNGQDSIAKFLQLKSQNPNVKLMISIGGPTFDSSVFSQIFSSPMTLSAFAASAVSFFQTYNFDGLDIYWKYPQSQDIDNFNNALTEIGNSFHPNNKILSVAVAAIQSTASVAYNVSVLCSQVDFINLMSFDYHGGWESKTGINSPLYVDPTDAKAELNVYASVNYWVYQGCSKRKIVVGIPLYGRAFALSDSANTDVGVSASGFGRVSSATGNDIIPYNEICVSLSCYGWTRKYQGAQRAPYLYSVDQWIGYDDNESVSIKLEFISKNLLGGAMFNSIDMEDYDNVCCKGKNSLVSMAYNELVTIPMSATTTTTTENPQPNVPIWNVEQVVYTPSNAPAFVDWSSHLLPVQDQKQCGSCWAFQTTAQIESMLKFNNPSYDTLLSRQFLVDCDIEKNGGCCGGVPSYAMEFIQQSNGMPTMIDYPYNAQNQTCSTNITIQNFPIRGVVAKYFDGDEEALKAWVATYGPSVAVFQVNDNFQWYQSGVYLDQALNKTFRCFEYNHALLLVGYGTDPTGGDYWLTRNSWGPNWGMEGFVKIARNRGNAYDIACISSLAYQ